MRAACLGFLVVGCQHSADAPMSLSLVHLQFVSPAANMTLLLCMDASALIEALAPARRRCVRGVFSRGGCIPTSTHRYRRCPHAAEAARGRQEPPDKHWGQLSALTGAVQSKLANQLPYKAL